VSEPRRALQRVTHTPLLMLNTKIYSRSEAQYLVPPNVGAQPGSPHYVHTPRHVVNATAAISARLYQHAVAAAAAESAPHDPAYIRTS